MKALVLGATGHIGNAVVRKLLSHGYDVTATGRRTDRPRTLVKLPVHYSPGDHDEPGQIEHWVAGHEIVVDAAAPYPVYLGASSRDVISHAVRRTRVLLDAVRRHDCRFVYVSSFTTLKRWEGRMEEWPAQLVTMIHPYFALKDRIEADVLEAADKGVPVVVVNPTMCLGPWDLHDRELCLVPRVLCGEFPASTRHTLNVIDVREVAEGIVKALEADRYGTPTLLSGHNISLQALFSWIAEIGRVRPPSITVPSGLGTFATYFTELGLSLTGLRTSIASLAPMLIYEHEWMPPCGPCANSRVTVRPLSETLIDSVRWYRKIGYC